jgi:hypothetical protein
MFGIKIMMVGLSEALIIVKGAFFFCSYFVEV